MNFWKLACNMFGKGLFQTSRSLRQSLADMPKHIAHHPRTILSPSRSGSAKMPCMFALGSQLQKDLLQATGVKSLRIQLLSFENADWGELAKVELSFVAFGLLEIFGASASFGLREASMGPWGLAGSLPGCVSLACTLPMYFVILRVARKRGAWLRITVVSRLAECAGFVS